MTHRPDPATERAALALLREVVDTSPDEREALLQARSADNPDLAARARQLLERFVEDDTRADAENLEDDAAGLIIGPYQVLRRIGRGGMGEVFLAQRADGAFQRQVALKRIWGGLSLLAERFQREREILARLAHPNIARLYDGGVTAQGQPWFAMEHVPGDCITRWCDDQQLPVERRVDLLATVCEAVQFAHNNLIVHRDLKPANVQVGTDGVPKLLDFGIAKLLDDADPQATQTLAMTPAWAAPEQRSGGLITTATDVWQLGTLLRVLVAGDPNPDVRLAAGYAALRRDDPARALAIAQARGTTPDRLQGALRGDLERIVAVATAPEPRDRYPTAQALVDDLRRWRGHLPVQAHSASWHYRLRKLLRRHRVASALVGAFALMTLAAGVFGWQRLQAERAQFRRAETTLSFLRDVFAANKPEKRKGEQYTAEQLLDHAAATLPEQFKDDPRTRAALEGEVGNVYLAMGYMAKARPHLEYAVEHLAGERDERPGPYMEMLEYLAHAYIEEGKPQATLDVLKRNMDFVRGLPAGGDEQPLASVLLLRGQAKQDLGLSDEASADYHQALRLLMADGGRPSKNKARAHTNVAVLLARGDRAREALPLYEAALRLHQSPESMEADRLVARYNIARAYGRLGETTEAIARYEEVLAPMKREVGPGHARLGSLYTQLSMAYGARGDYRKGVELLAQLQAEQPEDTDVITRALVESFQAELLTASLRPDLALPLVRQAIDRLEPEGYAGAAADPTDPHAHAMGTLAEALLQSGEVDDAQRAFQAAFDEGMTLAKGQLHEQPHSDMDALGRIAVLRGKPDEAIVWFERALKVLRRRTKFLSHEDARLVRSEIHLEWARAAKNGDAASVARLAAMRPRLAAAVQADEHPTLWQFDLLHARVAREYGGPAPATARLARSRQRLETLARGPLQEPVGLIFNR